MHAPAPRQVYFSAVLAAAAVVLIHPDLHMGSGGSAVLADVAVARPATVSAPAAQRFASYRASIPRPAATVPEPRVTNDLEAAARIIPRPKAVPKPAYTPAPRPSYTAHAVATATPARAPAPAYTPVASVSGAYGSPEAYAESLVGSAQFACLQPLWERESGWNTYADNPGSGAYGIPQSLPGSKMASAGADWATNPDTQIRWGVQDYIDPVYGSACAALAHEEKYSWY
jgi:hypothetical protein